MKKTLTLSMLAATILGGMMFTLPAEAYGGYHHEWRHPHYVANYNYNYNNYNPNYTGYQTVPFWQRMRTGWYR